MASNTSSKRGALRFTCFNLKLSYKTEYEDGSAELINASSNGCAIRNPTTELELNEKILLSILLEDLDQTIEVQAVIVRKDQGKYGLLFKHIEEDDKSRLVRFLAIENRRRKTDSTS